jgi:hypothetical protein
MKYYVAIKIEGDTKFVLDMDMNWVDFQNCPPWRKWQSTSASGAARKSKNEDGTGYELDEELSKPIVAHHHVYPEALQQEFRDVKLKLSSMDSPFLMRWMYTTDNHREWLSKYLVKESIKE